jgi:hypothetical protein
MLIGCSRRVANQKYRRMCDGAPISVTIIHLWASAYKSEIDGDIKDLIHLRQLGIQ